MNTSKAAGATTADAEIGNRIANALIVKNLNQRTLSDETGIPYATLRRSLAGTRSLTIRELTSIADVIKVQPSALLPDAIASRDAA